MYSNFMQNPNMLEALHSSSVSWDDAAQRAKEYQKIFARNEELQEFYNANKPNLLQKTFSGYAETPLLSTQYFNASVAAFVSSFAGFMSVERDFEQPTGLFYWFDVLGVSDLRNIIPNLGPDNYQDIQTMGGFEFEVTPSSGTQYSVIIGRKILPSSLRVKVVDKSSATTVVSKYELIDNGQGTFMAVAGKLGSTTVPTINYLNGKVEFELGTAVSDTTYSTITIVGKEDVTGTPSNTIGASNAHVNDKRVIAKMQQFGLTTVPDMLVAEYNIASLGALKKATGSDMASFLFTKLRELYTKTINYKLITTLEEGYNGNTLTDLDLNMNSLKGTFYDYRSRIDLFDSYLINVESALATKAVKGVSTTAYVAGNQAANMFQKGRMIGKFRKNDKMTYINDLLGWYDEIPVLRSTDIQENAGEGTFYAIHKTPDGQMAPLARGIYMPLTDTPTVGNYANPTQMAAGIYYQEGTRIMAPELAQKVTFKLGI